jgi:hypothetical protein
MCWVSRLSRYLIQFRMSLLIIFAMFLLSKPAFAKYSGGGGTATDPYRIRTFADWKTLMNASSDWDKHFVLIADIDLQGISLTPVGAPFPQALFFGVFDGSGYKISNANISMPNSDNIGLFGNLGLNGQIRNLAVINATINGRANVGALVGYNWGGNVINCCSTGSVSGNSSAGGLVGENSEGTIAQSYSTCAVTCDFGAGGLTGYNNAGTITQCSSTGTISGILSTGGLVGDNTSGIVTQCYSTGQVSGSYNTGGLTGYNNGNIAQCHSTSTVMGDDYVGTLIGYNQDGNVTQCFSAGSASGNFDVGDLAGYNNLGTIEKCYGTGTVSGILSVGGLVGENSAGIIIQCYSTSSVTGSSNIGGLVGNNNNTVTLSYSSSTTGGDKNAGGLAGLNTGDINDCYSTGTISGNEICIGGLIGENDGNAIRCYSTGAVSGKFDVGGLVGGGLGHALNCVWDMESSGLAGSSGGAGLTTIQMMDPNMLNLNGFANDPNWILDAGFDYPRLAWQGTPGEFIPAPDISWLEGAGTSELPYQIDTVEQLILTGKASILWDSDFVLGTDINLDPNFVDTNFIYANFVEPNLANGLVFGQAIIPFFRGVFDGNDHTISNLIIEGGSLLGVFGRLESEEALVKNLAIEDVNIIGSGRYIGSLMGYNNGSNVTMCSSNGIISGYAWVGGLTGYNSEGSVMQCCSAGAVGASLAVGGLIGENFEGSVTQCFSTSDVSGIYDTGGLVGCSWEAGLTQSYSTGAVSGSIYVGGLVGENIKGIVSQCYSTGYVTGNYDTGGLIGSNFYPYLVTQSFWDMQTSGTTTSSGGTGKTTTQMETQSTFTTAGWDFIGETENGLEDIWSILEGQDYPKLWWEPNRQN